MVSSSWSNSTATRDKSQDSAIFELDLDDAAVINKIISEVEDPDDNSILIMNEEGLRLIATGDRTSQVSAFFSRETFNRFVFNASEPVKYRFVLKEFTETLRILQDDAKDDDARPVKVSLKMVYRKRGDVLKLSLENGTNYTVSCDLKEFTLPSIHTLMSFAPYEEIADIHFYSKELYKFVSSLDTSSEFITLKLEPGEVPVKWATISSMYTASVEVLIYKDDDPPIIKRALSAPTNLVWEFNYRSKFLWPALKALRNSDTMLMKCGSSGLLLMEHHRGQETRTQSVEYFILCEATN